MKKLLFAALSLMTFNLTQAQQWGDYTLYAAQNGTTAYLIDTMDTPNTFHTWTFSSSYKSGYSCYLLPGGYLLRSVTKTGNSFTGGPITGEVQKVDWNGNIVWDYVYSTTSYCTHHDIKPMPNGNVLLIAYESKTTTEVSNAGGNNSIVMWPDKIVEVQPVGNNGGNIVWEWHAWDHLCQNVNSAKANYVTSISAHPELLNINNGQAKDWLHVNGVDYNPQLDQIVISSHAMSEIYVIDHSTTTAQAAAHSGGNSGKGGDILYRWGNPQNYGAGTSSNKILNVVHDAHWVPQGCPKAGYLVGFNNGGQSTPQKSCVDLINPPVNGYNYTLTGTAYSPASYDWRLVGLGYTSNEGGCQQLPNGNMLVTIALSGLFYEIDSNKNVLWQQTITGGGPGGGGVGAKVFRYSACYISGTPPAAPTISKTADTLFASGSATKYIWYLNGAMITGATNPKYTPTQNGAYTVKAVDSFGCASSLSTAFNFTVSGISNITTEEVNIVYPNPTNGIINIDLTQLGNSFEIKVIDNLGKEILNEKNSSKLDLSAFENGVYHLFFITAEKTGHQQITLLK